MGLVITCWILTILVPIHGAFFLAIRSDRVRMRKLLLTYWKLRKSK